MQFNKLLIRGSAASDLTLRVTYLLEFELSSFVGSLPLREYNVSLFVVGEGLGDHLDSEGLNFLHFINELKSNKGNCFISQKYLFESN